MGHVHHPASLAGPSAVRCTKRSRHTGCSLGPLLVVVLLVSLVSGCSFYAAGRTLVAYPLETIECFPECPYDTASVLLRHPVTDTLVECGPYPHALYASMAAVYRQERRQCVERYQRQGYIRLARAEFRHGR